MSRRARVAFTQTISRALERPDEITKTLMTVRAKVPSTPTIGGKRNESRSYRAASMAVRSTEAYMDKVAVKKALKPKKESKVTMMILRGRPTCQMTMNEAQLRCQNLKPCLAQVFQTTHRRVVKVRPRVVVDARSEGEEAILTWTMLTK